MHKQTAHQSKWRRKPEFGKIDAQANSASIQMEAQAGVW
jgi:hypothetical protein